MYNPGSIVEENIIIEVETVHKTNQVVETNVGQLYCRCDKCPIAQEHGFVGGSS